MQKVKIISAQTEATLDGTLILPENIKPNGKAILFLHGWRSSEDGCIDRAKALAELGYICLTFNLRGHGNSTGDIHKLTRQDFLNDAILAYDYLKNQKRVDPDKIAVVGASFGGYLATLLTKKRPVRWLALRAPANYPNEGFENMVQNQYIYETQTAKAWSQKQLDYRETISLQALHEYSHEVLLIESSNDIAVPHQAVQNYADAVTDQSKLTHIVMEGADHPLTEEKYKQKFIQILVDWFKDK